LGDVFADVGDEVVRGLVDTFVVGVVVAGCGGERSGGAVVQYASDVVGRVILTAGGLRDGADPEIRRDAGFVGGDNYVVALAWGLVG
jgi:hypothetical protein